MKENIRNVAKNLNPTRRKSAVKRLCEETGNRARTVDALYLGKGEVPERFQLKTLEVVQNELHTQRIEERQVLVESGYELKE